MIVDLSSFKHENLEPASYRVIKFQFSPTPNNVKTFYPKHGTLTCNTYSSSYGPLAQLCIDTGGQLQTTNRFSAQQGSHFEVDVSMNYKNNASLTCLINIFVTGPSADLSSFSIARKLSRSVRTRTERRTTTTKQRTTSFQRQTLDAVIPKPTKNIPLIITETITTSASSLTTPFKSSTRTATESHTTSTETSTQITASAQRTASRRQPRRLKGRLQLPIAGKLSRPLRTPTDSAISFQTQTKVTESHSPIQDGLMTLTGGRRTSSESTISEKKTASIFETTPTTTTTRQTNPTRIDGVRKYHDN